MAKDHDDELCREFTSFMRDWNGEGETIGWKTKIQILWQRHVWVMCTMSAVAGATLMFVAERLSRLLGGH